jgi:DmsE family decaheme c-type cytochrome
MDSACYSGVARGSCGAPLKAAALAQKFAILTFLVLLFGALFSFCQTVRAEPGKSVGNIYSDSEYSALLNFVQRVGVEDRTSKLANNTETRNPHARIDDEAYSALREFAQRVGAGQPEPVEVVGEKFAEADNAFGALRRFLQSSGQAKSERDDPTAALGADPKPVALAFADTATYVGDKACLTCHATQTETFSKTLMGKIGQTQPGKFACENCHGPASEHVKAGGGRGVGGLISFRPDDPSRTAEETNALCLGCHQKGDRTLWAGSRHEERGLMCTNCHTVMKDVSPKYQLKTAVQAETCYQCHTQKRAEMQRSSHMPIREGKMTCSNCHNPHGSVSESLIREASVNENCYKCHAEKRGPLLWEHAPVRENCLNCHDPHGSNYEYLLKVARPRLCHECHSFAHGTQGFGMPTSAYVLGRSCGNCHSNVHGSNHPNGMFFLR